jgi:tetratricopeptide (TPR) repeat protein
LPADQDFSMSDQDPAGVTITPARNAKASSVNLAAPIVFLDHWGGLLASVIISLAALVAYHNSFFGPFILDDVASIVENSSLRRSGTALSPPPAAGVGGRPILNFTFALNYALGGLDVRGYHAFNLLIHMLAGLALFGLVRRTLLRPRLAARFGADAFLLALVVAVIWTVHPLQTEAVTYISQRAESLMGLFYLLTLYFFVRGVELQEFCGRLSTASTTLPWAGPGYSAPVEAVSPERQSKAGVDWLLASFLVCLFGASVVACLLGTMSKEVIVTAPVLVFLYDRIFAASSFREAWRLRWRYYLGLACTWLLLAHSMTGLSQRGVGFEKVAWWRYALISCRSVVLYLKLAVWPHPLIFDYGLNVFPNAIVVVLCALVLFILLVGLVISLRRWPAVGFAGAWLFIILAPTSSVVPVALQPIAESRMYLSLAAIIALVVLGLYSLSGRRGLLVFVVAAMGLAWLTIRRNENYRSSLAIWSDTVAKRPENARAQTNLGKSLAQIPGRLPEAISHYAMALRIKPDYTEAHNNLGIALAKIPGRLPEAISHFEAAIRIKPDDADLHNNLGIALTKMPGRTSEAIAQYKAALRINPDSAAAHFGLGNVFLEIPGRLPEAIAQYEEALRLKPDLAPAREMLDRLQNSNGIEDVGQTDYSSRQ